MNKCKLRSHSLLSALVVCLALFSFGACNSDEEPQDYIGTPIPVSIDIEGMAQMTTRTATPMTTGTAYLIAGGDYRRYVYSSTTGVTSANPLVWTSLDPITIYGYYIDGGETMPNSTSAPSYTVNPSSASFLVGKDQVTFGGNHSVAQLTLRQQLAKVTVTVTSLDGSVISDAKLGGGLLYTTGTFSPASFNENGYANGGTNGTGWTPATNFDPETLSMTKNVTASSGNSYVFYAYVLPQLFSDTSVDFLVVKVTSGTLVHYVGFRLNAALTMKAGGTYNLVVDNVTNALYLNTNIVVDDIADSETADLIDNSSVNTVDPGA